MSPFNEKENITAIDYSSRSHYLTKVFPSPFYSRQEPLNHLKEWGR